MDHWGKVDQDDIVRARNVLLASGRRTPGEEVDAYRVLAQVSPASYLPLLAGALRRLAYDAGSGTRHACALELCEEAVAVARRIDPAEPARADVLYRALDGYRGELYRLDRHTEALTLCAEMLDISRARTGPAGVPVVKGLREWAAGLSEAGRYAEAADAMDELVAALLPDGPRSGALAWTLLDWIAALHDAGRFGEALAAFERLVTMEAAEAAADRGPMVCHLHALIGYARMLDTHGRDERAALARQEALAVLGELAETGERKTWSGYQRSLWAELLTLSGAYGDESAADEPRTPSGLAPMRGSPRARWRNADSRLALRAEVDALAPRAAEDPDRHLAELVRLHRSLTLRSAVFWEKRTRLFAEQARPLFDEGVDLARRLSGHDPAEGTRALARILTDRSGLHAAAHDFGPALDDFRQALTHLGEPAQGLVEPA
ncbi:hypothetical protein [Streptomyces durocortorensis]|uniref:Tetratricopeptide repeat protein n=1 Tax=Streptomyces durocortorensis TaxID=2811104 RepID=A0ABS2HPV6_9ACTN|nr:hypothetical protein [Streptomyces durocortorensis]MBM7052727.1 hypothetical protein [Streptomyces durocortorensis]